MFHMLSCFDLKDRVTVAEFQAANTRFAEFMREQGLIESIGQVGRRHKHPIMDTDSCLLYTSPSPRDQRGSRMPSSA